MLNDLSVSRFGRSPGPALVVGIATARTAILLPVALCRRDAVERCVYRRKAWRRIATHLKNRADTYPAMLALASLYLWLPRCTGRALKLDGPAAAPATSDLNMTDAPAPIGSGGVASGLVSG
jgi:hypothetical protein